MMTTTMMMIEKKTKTSKRTLSKAPSCHPCGFIHWSLGTVLFVATCLRTFGQWQPICISGMSRGICIGFLRVLSSTGTSGRGPNFSRYGTQLCYPGNTDRMGHRANTPVLSDGIEHDTINHLLMAFFLFSRFYAIAATKALLIFCKVCLIWNICGRSPPISQLVLCGGAHLLILSPFTVTQDTSGFCTNPHSRAEQPTSKKTTEQPFRAIWTLKMDLIHMWLDTLNGGIFNHPSSLPTRWSDSINAINFEPHLEKNLQMCWVLKDGSLLFPEKWQWNQIDTGQRKIMVNKNLVCTQIILFSAVLTNDGLPPSSVKPQPEVSKNGWIID